MSSETSGTFASAVPFALAFLCLILQPVLDRTWRQTYKAEYDKTGSDDLMGAAQWIADTAQFLPSSLLTITGVALLIPEDAADAWTILTLSVGPLLAVCVYIMASTKKDMGNLPSPYSWLQYLLMVLNVTGFVLSLLL